jgi:hypothetical protein
MRKTSNILYIFSVIYNNFLYVFLKLKSIHYSAVFHCKIIVPVGAFLFEIFS